MSEPGTAEWRRTEASRLITFGRAAALADGGFGWLGANGEIDATQPCPLYLNSRGANSNMHSVEAYLAAGDVTGNPVWHARAASIATHLINGHARAHTWRIPEHYDQSWQPLPEYNLDRRNDPLRPDA